MRPVLFEICYTQRDGTRVTGQIYTYDFVSHRLEELIKWGATDITMHEYNERGIDE